MSKFIGYILITLSVIHSYTIFYDGLVFFSKYGASSTELLVLLLSIILATLVWILTILYIGKQDGKKIQTTNC